MKFIKKHEEELQDLVKNWRRSNLNIVKFWWETHKAAINDLKNREINIVGNIKIYYESDIMFIILPSGRKLSYVKPRIEKNKYGGDSITYEGISATKKWERIETYGTKEQELYMRNNYMYIINIRTRTRA